MSNRINGDFNSETIEAFRAAYAAQLLSPEDQEVDERTGLPTNLVLNTSPWIQHTGLWKANDGTDKNFVPNQTLIPGEIDPNEEEEGVDLEEEEDDFPELEELLKELEEEGDIEALIDEILDERLGEEEGNEEDVETDAEEDEEILSEEDIDALIAELELELETDLGD